MLTAQADAEKIKVCDQGCLELKGSVEGRRKYLFRCDFQVARNPLKFGTLTLFVSQNDPVFLSTSGETRRDLTTNVNNFQGILCI